MYAGPCRTVNKVVLSGSSAVQWQVEKAVWQLCIPASETLVSQHRYVVLRSGMARDQPHGEVGGDGGEEEYGHGGNLFQVRFRCNV